MYQIECTYQGIVKGMHDRFLTSQDQQEGKKTPETKIEDKFYQDDNGLYLPADNIRMMLIGNQMRRGAALILGSDIESKKGEFYTSFCKGCIWVAGEDGSDKIYYAPLRKWDKKDKEQIDIRSFPFGTGKTKGRRLITRPLILLPWSLSFVISVTDDNFPEEKVRKLFNVAGLRCGAGAYGPNFGRCIIPDDSWKVIPNKKKKAS